MAVNLFINSTILDATKDMISTIDNSDFSVDHIVVVPDKFSLQMEKLLLRTLPNKALFNVRVLGITGLANEILNKLNKSVEVLSTGESLLLTQKAIENVKSDFLTFRKSNISFCHEINKIISQLKSSLVDSDSLNIEAKGMTGQKYHDIMLIYKEYERLRGEKLDVNTRLSLASNLLLENDIFNNTKIYFGEFDAFTKEGYNLLKSLILKASEVNISLTQSLNIGNDYIYEKDIYQKLVELSKECGCAFKVINKTPKFSQEKLALINGIYSFQKVKCENKGFYTLFSASNLTEEVNAVAKIIYNFITRGYNYNDIVVMTSDLSKYENLIENSFSCFDIPYFIDSSVLADNTILVNTIFAFFNVILSSYSNDSILNLMTNLLIERNNDLIEKTEKFIVDNKFKYKKFLSKDFAYDDILTKLENCKTTFDFANVVKEIIQRVKEKYEDELANLENKQYLKEKNINIQVEEIVEETIELINSYGNEEISLNEYMKKLKLLLSFKQVSTVPTFVDGVLVGDATSSSTLNCKILIVLGSQNLPQTSSDNGFLSDEDLSLNYADKQIEPTIRMINRRNRFKLFNLLTKADEKLILTYQVLNEEGKKNEVPTFVSSLNSIFDIQSIKINDVFNAFDDKFLLLSLGNRKNFAQEFGHLINKETKEKFNIEHIKNKINKNNIDLKADDVFFDKNYIRVTQIEQYFSCPFKHFVSYGLGLKEKEIYRFEVSDIGTVCHSGAELFVKSLIENNYNLDVDIVKFIDKNFYKLLKNSKLDEKFESLPEKKSLERYLKNQLRTIFQDIVREMKVSKFRPKYLEMSFNNIKLGERHKINLIGKADRIDISGDYFRIIDYKTGLTGNLLKELYYGNKLQLFLYQKTAKDILKKKAAGVYYFNAKYDYAKGDEDKKLLKGLTQNDDEVIDMTDNQIAVNGKSSILSISLASDDKKGKYKGNGLAKEDLEVYENYAKKVADKAVDEIYEGFIQPKPDDKACKYCAFASICMYEKISGTRNKNVIGEFKSEK